MPIGDNIIAGAESIAPNTPGSAKADWIVLNSDFTTAQSAADALFPSGVDDASAKWVRVPDNATRLLVAGTVNAATTAVSTDPVVKIFASSNVGSDKTARSDSDSPRKGIMHRADSPTDITAAGVTLDFGTTLLADNISYSTTAGASTNIICPLPSATGYDLLGAHWVLVIVSTAGVLTGTGAAGEVIGKFLN